MPPFPLFGLSLQSPRGHVSFLAVDVPVADLAGPVARRARVGHDRLCGGLARLQDCVEWSSRTRCRLGIVRGEPMPLSASVGDKALPRPSISPTTMTSSASIVMP
jgi:hypothetical protein